MASSTIKGAVTRVLAVAAVALLGGCYRTDTRETPHEVLTPPGISGSRAAGPGETPLRDQDDPGDEPELPPPFAEALTCANGVEAWSRDCPDAVIVYVSTDGSDDAPGTGEAPLASPAVASQRCGATACHLRIQAGRYDMRDAGIGGRCLRVEGGLTTAADGTWQRDPTARSELVGDGYIGSMINSDGGALLVEGVTVTNPHSGITTQRARLVILSDVEVAAVYGG